MQSKCGKIPDRHASNFIIKQPRLPLSDEDAAQKKLTLSTHRDYLREFIPPTRIAKVDNEWIIVQKEIHGRLLKECEMAELPEYTKAKIVELMQGCVKMLRETTLMADISGWQGKEIQEGNTPKWIERARKIAHLREVLRDQFHDSLLAASTNIIIDEEDHPWLVDCTDAISPSEMGKSASPVESFYIKYLKPRLVQLLCHLLNKQHILVGEKSIHNEIALLT